MDPMAMTDGEFVTYRARWSAAACARREGDETLADAIRRGEADDHWRVRWAMFFFGPRVEPDAEWNAAWKEFALADRCRTERQYG